MNIRFNIKDPNAAVSAIRLILTHKGKVYRRNTGVSVQPKQWFTKKQKCSDTSKDKQLKLIRVALEERLDDFSSEGEVLKALDEVLDGKEVESGIPTFWEYFEMRTKEGAARRRQVATPYNKIRALMGTRENWEDIDSAYYERLVRRMNEDGLSINTQGTVISRLKAIMHEGFKMKYHTNADFREFKKLQEESDSVALTQEEVDKLWAFTTSKTREQHLLIARDIFIVGIYTASRYSDYSKFSMENIVDGKLVYTSKKTHERVIMPASSRVIEVMKRNGGRVPEMVEQFYNRSLKTLCRLAGIDSVVYKTTSVGREHITEAKKKYELVSSHTARRTGATLLYREGVPIANCMFITGHRSESSFMKYIKITKEENAKRLESLPFFK